MTSSKVSNAPYLLQDLNGHVLWLTLNRPESRNSLSLGMITALKEALEKAHAEPSVRVIVLASQGPVFSSGHHLGEMSAGESRDEEITNQREILTACAAMMLTISHGAKPVIACVQGTATAAGCQLVATCDLAVASADADFCTPGVNIGGFCTTPLVGIGRKVRRNHAMELALTGDKFSSEDAFRFGLVNRVVPHGALQEETTALAEKIASKSNQAIQMGKKVFYQQIDMPIEEAYAFATEKMIENTDTDDSREGRKAFFEKRQPKWTDI